MGGLLHRGNKTHQGQLYSLYFQPSLMIRTPHTRTRTSHRNGRILAKTVKILLWHLITKRVAKKSALVFSFLSSNSGSLKVILAAMLRHLSRMGERRRMQFQDWECLNSIRHNTRCLSVTRIEAQDSLRSPYHPLPSSRELHSTRGRSLHCEENHSKLTEGLWLFQLSLDSLQQLLKNTEKGVLQHLVFLSHLLFSHETALLTIFKQW